MHLQMELRLQVSKFLFRLNTHPEHVIMGRVGATAIASTHKCRWFLFCLIVAFHCCLPSIHDDVREFLATFG